MPIFSQAHIDLESQLHSVIQAEDTEAGGSHIQGLPGLQNDFDSNLSNLERASHKKPKPRAVVWHVNKRSERGNSELGINITVLNMHWSQWHQNKVPR